jgi:hypothetical protein
MDPLARASLLHQEADEILQIIRFHEIMAPFGPLTFTGSYFLDLMAFPDIDVEAPTMTEGQIFDVLARLFEKPVGEPGRVRETKRPAPAEGVVLQTTHPIWRLGPPVEDRYLVAGAGADRRWGERDAAHQSVDHTGDASSDLEL